jgi:hypothetical protein
MTDLVDTAIAECHHNNLDKDRIIDVLSPLVA